MQLSLADHYREMLIIRLVEEQLMVAMTSGLVSGSTHLCIGQEAIPVGACSVLRKDDPLIATYRGHGWALARGVSPVDLMAEVMGRDSALNGGRAGSAYLSAPLNHFYGENSIVGAGVPVALGLAIACQRAGDGRVPLVSIGDGAMNQGNVHESLNMGSVLEIPMILMVENNGYAEMTPSHALTAVPAIARAAAYDIPGFETDGNDPIAVASTVAKAREIALAQSTTVLVEAHTHRLAGHYSGDVQAYRPAGELQEKHESCPLARAEEQLTQDEVTQIRASVVSYIAHEFAAATQIPAPSPEGAFDYVFSS
ncbi:MAG: thiamine pyrophosphate-dependent dehydrogenase E1 component subunit alpha [Actinomycetes bacterium]